MTHPGNRGAPDEAVYAHLAKAIVLHCFRNTFLEDLHAGIHPDSATGDYTDVKVVSPFGEIPWNRLGRISDAEMRILMRQCVNRVYTYLLHLETSRGLRVDPRWDPPELDPGMMDDLEAISAPGRRRHALPVGRARGTAPGRGSDPAAPAPVAPGRRLSRR